MIVIVAEGAVKGGVAEIADAVKKKFNHYDIRISILGHMQRGGNPSCFDRLLASRLGNEAVKNLLLGKQNVMVGQKNNKITFTTFSRASSGKHKINYELLEMVNELSA